MAGTAKVPFTPSAEERRLLSHHLYYDIWMTFRLADVLDGRFRFRTPAVSELDELERNAMVESFVVRIRSLVEFFWHDRRTREDALAADYFEPGIWKQMRPDRPPLLNTEVTGKVDWGGMHLTYRRARADPAEKGWPGIPMCLALEPTVRLFIDNVGAAQFDPQWFTAIQPVLDGFKAQYGHVTP